VFVSFNGNMAFEDTLNQALDVVFGKGASPPVDVGSGGTSGGTGSGGSTLQDALNRRSRPTTTARRP